MEKNYTKIVGKDYRDACITSGEVKPVVAVKFARVKARPGIVGEEITTYTQGGLVEKVDTVKQDQETGKVDWVLTKVDENGEVIIDEFGHDNSWIIKHAQFTKKYEKDETKAEGIYKPVGGPQIFLPIVMDVIIEQWGSEMTIDAGGWLNITNPEDIYGISERDFTDTYKIVEEDTIKYTKKQ